jgi:hypothetical protein
MHVDAQFIATARNLIDSIDDRLDGIRGDVISEGVIRAGTPRSSIYIHMARALDDLDTLRSMFAELDVVDDPAGDSLDTGPYGLDAAFKGDTSGYDLARLRERVLHHARLLARRVEEGSPEAYANSEADEAAGEKAAH